MNTAAHLTRWAIFSQNALKKPGAIQPQEQFISDIKYGAKITGSEQKTSAVSLMNSGPKEFLQRLGQSII